MDNSQARLERRSSSAVARMRKKKFDKPPVKVACLSCRSSRIRCDGETPCSGCAAKGKECFYLPSKRGGPRKKRTSALTPVTGDDFDDTTFQQVDTLAAPAAGLRHLDIPLDMSPMFEGPIESSNSGGLTHGSGSVSAPSVQAHTPQEPTRVRVYGSELDILNAYYIFIHQYFPIFPPPTTPATLDRPLDLPSSAPDPTLTGTTLLYQPQSPVSLAISAILALVPHPDDPNPSDAQSVLLRRSYAHRFAWLAFDAIEADSELVESSAIPSQALQNDQAAPSRFAIHSRTPVELESLLALLILSIYEYTQRGNLAKMRSRAGQAYMMAMNMSLHALGPEVDAFSEAKRRAWWMTFYCISQGSIVGTTSSQVIYNDPRFVTPYPNFAADTEAWSLLIQSQRVLLAATQYIIDLNHILRARGSTLQIHDRMKKLDGWIRTVMGQVDSPTSTLLVSDDGYSSEVITSQSIRSISRIKLCSARIKTHRFRAFSDIPIFIKKHCDLACASIQCAESEKPTVNIDNSTSSRIACCSNFSQIPYTASTEASAVPWVNEAPFPFSSLESIAICLQSALTIAQMFDTLPFPNPSYKIDGSDGPLAGSPRDSGFRPPRTMPSFACCSMQSSYAMLMLYYRSRAIKHQAENENQPLDADDLADELFWGLNCVLGAVRNYAEAFEALGGMKEEIEGAILTAFPP